VAPCLLPSYSKSQVLVVENAFAGLHLSWFQSHKTYLFLGIFACGLKLFVLLYEDMETGKMSLCHTSSSVTGHIGKAFLFLVELA